MAEKKADAKDKKPKRKATGFTPVKHKDFTISQKRTGRYQVVNSKGKAVNGADKVNVLIEAKLLKHASKKGNTPKEAPQA